MNKFHLLDPKIDSISVTRAEVAREIKGHSKTRSVDAPLIQFLLIELSSFFLALICFQQLN